MQLTPECQNIWDKLIELKGEINKSTLITGDFKTLPSKIDRPSWQKISKDVKEWNNIINLPELIDIYGIILAICPVD